MGPARLYQHLRENGLKVTKKEAEDLLNCWLSTFPEMNEHFNSRPPIRRDKWVRYGVVTEEGEGGGLDDDPFKEKRKTRQLYKAVTITGFVRNRATQNAACNCDFQNPVAHLAKEALWNLECAGLGDRLFCFVHEKYIILKRCFMYKIYKWQNVINKKCYIGITKQATLRQRFGREGQGYRGFPRFYSAIKKYGYQNFKGCILQQLQSRQQAAERQKYYIQKFDTRNPQKGYNLQQGGFPEVQQKSGTRAQKISTTLKKQRGSAQYRLLMSKRSQSLWNDPRRKKTVLQKRKGKLTGRPAIALYCYQTDTIYKSIADASKALNVSEVCLSKHLKTIHQEDFIIKPKHRFQYTLRRAR